MKQDLSHLRQEYTRMNLDEAEIADDPIQQFARWFEEARQEETIEPNAMTLATVLNGQPSARVVLLKSFDKAGFVFFTNYESDKGKALQQHPQAALNFFWPALERQVRIEGTAERVSEQASDAYFQTRDRGSQIGAWASPQSRPIAGREEIEQKVAEWQQQYDEQEQVQRPPHWGGFCLRPSRMEFWQGRPSRLHDRINYQRQSDGSWQVQRLAP